MSGYVSPESRAELGPPCCVPGCQVREDGSGATCVIWGGKRLCYAHFADFASHPLSESCSDRGAGPTSAEWWKFLASLETPTTTKGITP